MDQAFAAIRNVLKADDPFRDYARDGELRIAGQKLLNLVADGVTDPGRLRRLTVESLLPGHWRAEISGRAHKKGRTSKSLFRGKPRGGLFSSQTARGVPLPFGSSSCAAAYSGERLRSDENEASVIKARTSVVSIACDLLNKLAIRLEDLFVSALEVNAFGKISQRLVAHPAKNWALPIRHPELDTVAGR
jgi:hypothetical protein